MILITILLSKYTAYYYFIKNENDQVESSGIKRNQVINN